MSLMTKTFRYRLYPTKSQIVALDDHLGECCRLYNAALQERRDAYRIARAKVGFFDQASQLKDIRAAGDIGVVNFSVARDVLRRVDTAFQGFFRRIKTGRGKAGFPRFKARARFDSLTFPDYRVGVRLFDTGVLHAHGIGEIKVKLHRPVKGCIKTVTIKREAGKWFGLFAVDCEPEPLPPSMETVGVDVGLTSFATLSDGQTIDNPRYARLAERRLRVAQRKLARRKRGSVRRRKAVRELQAAYLNVQHQRSDFHHKASRAIVDRYGLIAVEDLNIKGLAAGRLAKSVTDAGWSTFINMLAYKAESAGRELVKVDPRGTSQTCTCGASVRKTLSQRWHQCSDCGLSLPRDHVSALVILQRGRMDPSGVNVEDRISCVA